METGSRACKTTLEFSKLLKLFLQFQTANWSLNIIDLFLYNLFPTTFLSQLVFLKRSARILPISTELITLFAPLQRQKLQLVPLQIHKTNN